MLSAPIKRLGQASGLTAARAFSTGGLQDAVIVSAARTPIGSIGSSLASLTGPQLGSIAVRGALEKAGIAADVVDEVYLGNVCSANLGQAPARQAALGAGLPESVPCTTVNKVCASGMKAIMLAAQSIMTGQQSCIVAGGFESMSNIPYYVPKARTGYGYGHGELLDGVVKDGLWDVYNDVHMGVCAEACNDKFGFTREQQDAFALKSYAAAAAATKAGRFANEIVPVTIKSRKGEVQVTVDEEFSRVNVDKVPTLRPPFKKDGSVTAANASSLNDGASALIVMSAARAAELGVKPLARIRGFADAAQAPVEFTTAPALAVPKALAHAGVTTDDIDFHEINEAFACVVLANMQLLNIDPERVNVNGGAVALGHPIGNSGSRIVATLLNVLQQNDATLGTASICNGGGGAAAMVIERLQ